MDERTVRTAKPIFNIKSADRTTLIAPKVVPAKHVKAKTE